MDDDGDGELVFDGDVPLDLAPLLLLLPGQPSLAVVVDVGQEEVRALLLEDQRPPEDARAVRHRHLELAVLGLDHDLAGVDSLVTD